jgi:hypothetical protein
MTSLPTGRLLISISAFAALAILPVACGDGGGGEDADSQRALDRVSLSQHNVKSGELDLKFGLRVRQYDEADGKEGGSVNVEVSGPFESQGPNRAPKFDFNVAGGYHNFNPAGEGDFSFAGGLVSTGDAGFVNFAVTDYQMDPKVFDAGIYQMDPTVFALFKAVLGINSPRSRLTNLGGGSLLGALGIKDPKPLLIFISNAQLPKALASKDAVSLLTNLSIERDVDVGGTSTTHVSGDLDLEKTADALVTPLTGGESSKPPSPSQLDQFKSEIKGFIKQAHFDFYSDNDNHMLRRFEVNFALSGVSVKRVDFNLDVTLGSVNKPQTIEVPSNAKPLADARCVLSPICPWLVRLRKSYPALQGLGD